MRTSNLILIKIFTLLITFNLFAQSNPPLTITPLKGDFYLYTTYRSLGGKPFPSNSMYLVTSDGVVMIDSPWDTTQFQPLLDSIQSKHGKKPIICIATHSHEDRTAAFDFLKEKGVKTYTSKKTYELSKQNKDKLADYLFEEDTVFTVGEYSFQTYFPGEGHTKDNIVIWFEKDRVLYGGCFVKSAEATDLGYTAEGNLTEWPLAINKLKRRFPNPSIIIPGHQDWKSLKSLDHTLKLLEENKTKGNQKN